MSNVINCLNCGSANIKKNGIRFFKQRFKCRDCGKEFKDDVGENSNKVTFENNGNSAKLNVKMSDIESVESVVKSCNIDLKIWKIEKYVINKSDAKTEVKISLSKIIPDVEKFPTPQPIRINSQKYSYKDGGKKDKFKKALILPDSQVGFLKDVHTNELDPFHDRRCFDLILKVTEEIKPDMVVFLGDMLDLPEQSDKFLKSPEFYFTTQPAIVELGWWISQIRHIVPNAKMVYLSGNHEHRLHKSLVTNLIHSYNLKPYNKLGGHSVLSVENLLGLKDLNVEYIDNYPKNEFWINSNLRVIHGDFSKSESGETVKEILKGARSSVIQGHIHRLESASKTVHTKDKIISYTAASFGCLCRLDGIVPSFKGNENWQNGFGLVEYKDGNDIFQIHSYSINDGVVLFHDKVIEGDENSYLEKLKKDTGWKF